MGCSVMCQSLFANWVARFSHGFQTLHVSARIKLSNIGTCEVQFVVKFCILAILYCFNQLLRSSALCVPLPLGCAHRRCNILKKMHSVQKIEYIVDPKTGRHIKVGSTSRRCKKLVKQNVIKPHGQKFERKYSLHINLPWHILNIRWSNPSPPPS